VGTSSQPVLQLATTHCNKMQHTATHCNTLLICTADVKGAHQALLHFNTLHHTATHCTTLPSISRRIRTHTHTRTHAHTHTRTNVRTRKSRACTNTNTHVYLYFGKMYVRIIFVCISVYCPIAVRSCVCIHERERECA